MFNDLFTDQKDQEQKNKNTIKVTDGDWLSDSFMVKSSLLDAPYKFKRFATIVENKFTDTSLGGSISLNVMPQFTRYADIRVKGLLETRNSVRVDDASGNYGMGRYYGEAIDDNSTNVYFEFGLPKFNNILFYLMSAVDYKTSVIANTGRSPFFYDAGYVFGIGALVIAFPIIAPIALIVKATATLASAMFAGNGRFDQYYLNPTMFLYWSSVNSIATMMATELGLLTNLPANKNFEKDKLGVNLKVDQEELDNIKRLMPGLITEHNMINVHATVAKAQKRYIQYLTEKHKKLKELASGAMSDTDTSLVLNVPEVEVNNLWEELKDPMQKDPSYFSKKKAEVSKTTQNNTAEALAEAKKKGEELKKQFEPDKEGRVKRSLRPEDSKSWLNRFWETSKAVASEGAKYAVFRVDFLGSASESFSNSVTNVEIGDTINSMGEKWRSMKFNLGAGGIPGVSDVVGAVTDFAVGALDGVTLGLSNVVGSFLSGANVDVPKRWSSSSASFPTLSFKMTLISPTAHPVAQMRAIYIPLAAILAGTLPLSTGPRSSTSPYLCSMFVRGYQRISMGMITSLSITRGTSNLPFNKQRRPLAVEVTFTVTDFSDSISAPVSSSLLDLGSAVYDDDSGLSKYISSLCSRDLYTTIHIKDRASIRWSRLWQGVDELTSPEYWGNKVGDFISTSPLAIFTDRKQVGYMENL